MKTFKIILGILLTWAAGNEYVHAGKELSTFFSPAIIAASLTLIFLSSWLIASGVSKGEFRIKSRHYLKYLGLTLIVFLFSVFISKATFKFEPEIVKENGVNVDIAELMHGMKGMIPDKNQRKQCCVCMVEKLTADKNLVERYQTEFEKGNLSEIFDEAQAVENADKYNLQECFSSVSKIEWTPEFEKMLRTNLMKQLTEFQISTTNDINKHCDCLIDEFKKIPFSKLKEANFNMSDIRMKIDSICNLKSKLK